MKTRFIPSLAGFALITTVAACTQEEEKSTDAPVQEEKRVEHHITGNGFDHTFNTKEGMKSALSGVGKLVEKNGEDVFEEKACINIEFASGYDFQVFHEPISIEEAYTQITDPEHSQTGYKVIEQKDDYLIYEAMEGEIPFHSVLVNVKAGDESFSTITEQVHFNEGKKLVLDLEDCREVVKIMRSIKKAK